MKILKNLKGFIYQFDQFGQPINLMINKDNAYHTVLGSFVSLGIIAFTLFSLNSLLLDLYNQKDPNLVSKITYVKDPKLFNLTTENFRISLAVADLMGIPILNTPQEIYYRIYTGFCTTITGVETKCLKSRLIPCKQVSQNAFIEKLQIAPEMNMISYCIDDIEWTNKNPIQLQGTGTSAIFKHLDIYLESCKENPIYPDEVCASVESIQERLQSGYIGFNFVDNLLDQQNPKEPFTAINKLQLFSYSIKGNVKKVLFSMRHSIVTTFFNPFYYFGETIVNHTLQYYKREEDSNTPQQDQVFMDIIFSLDDQQFEYFRTYSTIFDVFGAISGSFQFMNLFFGFFLLPLTKSLMNWSILDKIFSFPSMEEQKKVNRLSMAINPQAKLSLDKRQTVVLDKLRNPNSSFERDSELKGFLKQKSKQLKIQGFEYFTAFCCGNKKKLMDQGQAKYESKLDVGYLVRKLQEIDKLKVLLLTNNQLKLFDYIQKPTISSLQTQIQQQPIGQMDYFAEEQTFEQKVFNALDAYKQIHSGEMKNQLNVKIINMLDWEIRQVFQSYVEDPQTDQNDRLLQQGVHDPSMVKARVIDQQGFIFKQIRQSEIE